LNNFYSILKRFLHDPIDKPFDIPTHIIRAREYANILGISGIEEAETSDQIASCMERSLLPSGIKQKFNEIRHPLCDEKLGVSSPDIKEVTDIVKDTLNKIAEQIYHCDDKDKFLYLWRNLFQIIFERIKNKSYSKFWSIIPADTRVPDHSIWEHLKVSSAINAFANSQNNSIFLFTLGPVQSFISQARKAQDLFAGSFILSYLIFIGMVEILDRYGPTSIIYPDLFAQPLMDWYLENVIKIDVKNSTSPHIEIPTIPNRFVAIIPETDEAKISEVAKGIINKVKDKWDEMSDEVLSSFKIDKDKEIERQLQDFPKIYWVAVPWRRGNKDITIDDLSIFFSDEEIRNLKKLFEFAYRKGEFKPNIGLLYQSLYTSVEKSIGTRKNLRNFNQKKEYGKKCSICGEKEAVIKAGMGKLRVGKFISKNEGLCTLCFVKRGLEKYFHREFGNEISFPSTAEVAVSDFKQRALKGCRNEFEKYILKFKEISKDKFQRVNPLPSIKSYFEEIENLEGEWFFEENLRKEAFEKYLDITIDNSELEELKNKLKNITDKAGFPNPYFAVVLLDGDDMGRWLSGKFLPSIEYAYNSEVWKNLPDDFKNQLKNITPRKILTPAIHSAVSTALRNYSIEFAQKIVEEEHLGKLIYSGGDDLLAFVNLKNLFPVMRKLRAAFSGRIKFQDGKIEVNWKNKTGFVEKDNKFLLTMGKNATASMGVVIAHYKMPLRIILTKLKEMEKKAKDLKEKDAFCIALLKHSGEERIGLSKWRYDTLDVVKELEELSKRMIKKVDEPYLSDKFIHNLRNEFLKLTDEDGKFTGPGEIFNIELKRLMSRAYNGSKDERKEFIEKFYNSLKEIFWSTNADIQNFLHLLEILAFINQERGE